jgi:Zn-finger protein
MKCEICGKTPFQDVVLHRVNPFGVKGVWRCYNCLTPEQKQQVDPETKRLADIIAKGKHT